MAANLCRRNVVVRDGPEGFTTFKLDTAAIAQRLLVGRAQLWSTEANCFVFSAVLVDSLSEVTMAVELGANYEAIVGLRLDAVLL